MLRLEYHTSPICVSRRYHILDSGNKAVPFGALRLFNAVCPALNADCESPNHSVMVVIRCILIGLASTSQHRHIRVATERQFSRQVGGLDPISLQSALDVRGYYVSLQARTDGYYSSVPPESAHCKIPNLKISGDIAAG